MHVWANLNFNSKLTFKDLAATITYYLHWLCFQCLNQILAACLVGLNFKVLAAIIKKLPKTNVSILSLATEITVS